MLGVRLSPKSFPRCPTVGTKHQNLALCGVLLSASKLYRLMLCFVFSKLLFLSQWQILFTIIIPKEEIVAQMSIVHIVVKYCSQKAITAVWDNMLNLCVMKLIVTWI